jgi:exodeoxyribonuclease VII small subunit
MADTDRPDIATLSFEQAQSELEQVVEQLEDPHTGLEQALALWERGEQLHAHCQGKLDYAAERIEKLTVTPADAEAAIADADGANGTTPDSMF